MTKCNQLTALPFKGLMSFKIWEPRSKAMELRFWSSKTIVTICKTGIVARLKLCQEAISETYTCYCVYQQCEDSPYHSARIPTCGHQQLAAKPHRVSVVETASNLYSEVTMLNNVLLLRKQDCHSVKGTPSACVYLITLV